MPPLLFGRFDGLDAAPARCSGWRPHAACDAGPDGRHRGPEQSSVRPRRPAVGAHPGPLVVPGGRWHGGDADVQQDCETALDIAEIVQKEVGAICTSERKDPDEGMRVRIRLVGFGPNNKFYFCWGCVPT